MRETRHPAEAMPMRPACCQPNRSIPRLLAGLAVFLLAAPPFGLALSTGGAPLSLRDLARRADVVVIGDVVLAEGLWDAAGATILTRVDLGVVRVLKGSAPGPRLSFFVLGGRVGDVGAVVAGAPSFAPGERVLLFLSRRPDGTLRVAALYQGKFALERDAATGGDVAVRRVSDSGQVLDRIPLDQAQREVLEALRP